MDADDDAEPDFDKEAAAAAAEAEDGCDEGSSSSPKARWEVGQQVWVRWVEKDNSEQWDKARIHAFSTSGKSLSVMTEDGKRQSDWIRKSSWARELRPRNEEATSPSTDKDASKRKERGTPEASLRNRRSSPEQKKVRNEGGDGEDEEEGSSG
eukprot:gene16948-5496_t